MNLRCLVVMVTRNRKGQPIRSARLAVGDPITIGRSPESSVHLPDPRLHLRHALIRNNDLGKLYLEAQEAPIVVNGETQIATKLRRGARILIGPYKVTPEPPSGPDHDFGLAIEMVQPLTEGVAELRDRSLTSLDSTWLSRRALSWMALLIVSTLGLALPLLYAASAQERQRAMAAPAPAVGGVAWSAAWDAGPLALGHQMIGNRCEACHQAPFQRVQDAACVKCHVPTATPDHVSPVAAKAGVTLGTRCAECHRDHRGEHALVRTDPVLCVDCHRNIKALYPSTRLAAISDFGSNHSPFALSMVNAASGRIEKVFPGAPGFAGEASGLKFPHATHMAKKGIRTPTGVRVLECSQCHKLDGAGERFEPIRMEGNCSECHRLEFEPAATTRQVPHGKPLEILTALREFYSGIAVGETPIDVTLVNDLLRRPVAEPGRTERVRARAWADQKALSVATDLVERRVCVQCHQVSREAGLTLVSAGAEPGWTIQPVRITSHWLPGSAFGHKAHQQAACEKCHDVQSSRVSADIAIPDLASCRSCHGGTLVTPGKLTSPCETCHSFHQHGKPGVRPPTPMVVASLAAPGVAGSR